MTSTFVLQIAIVLGALAWKGQRLRRSRQFVPDSGIPWVIIVGLAALTLTLILHLPAGHPGGPRGLVPHLIQLGQNATLIATFVALQLLYTGYRAEEGRRYSGRWEIVIASAVLAVMTGLTVWAVLTDNSLSYSPGSLHRPVVATFFLLPTVYVLYAAGSQLVYGLWYAAQSRSCRRAASLGLISIGMALLFAATALRGWITVNTVTGRGFTVELRETASFLISIGNPTVAVGLVTPLVGRRIIAVLSRMRAGRMYREIEPLWMLLSWTFPQFVRPPRPASPTTGGPAESESGYTESDRPTIGFLAAGRRSVCRDGFGLLRPYLVGETPIPEDSRVGRAVREIIAANVVIPSATSVNGSDRRNAYRADTRELVAISRALKTRDLSWCTPNMRGARVTDAVIVAGQVLLGPAGQAIRDGAVVVRDGRIMDCGPRDVVAARAPSNALRFEFPNSTLLPGLINSHVHFAFDASDDPVAAYQAAGREALISGMAQRAAQALGAGITTVRDLGGPVEVFDVRDSVANGDCLGPRILASGPPLTVPRGHCWFFGGEVNLASEPEDTLRAMVQRNAAAGADLIKVMASGGHMTPGGPSMFESQFTTDHLRIIVAEAERLGLRVAAHAHGADAITSATEAGVATIEHCGWMTGPGTFDRREHVARQMADKHIYACAALNQDWLPFYHRLGDRAAGVFGRFVWMDSLGVPFISGTDAGLPGSVFDNYAGALGLYPWLGFSNDRTLEFATVNAADALGLGQKTGRISEGFDADLLVVDGDPLASLDALSNVQLVVTPNFIHTPSGVAGDQGGDARGLEHHD